MLSVGPKKKDSYFPVFLLGVSWRAELLLLTNEMVSRRIYYEEFRSEIR